MKSSWDFDASFRDKMESPVKIGARGTIGSLITQEMEHFGGIQSSRSQETRTGIVAMDSDGIIQPSSAAGLLLNPKKERRGGSGLLPSICSMIDVSNDRRPIRLSSFNYRSLRFDAKLPV